MTDTQKPNKPLFSQHYLKFRIQELPEWQLDITSEFEQLNKLYFAKKAILPTLNESQTEEEFIKPVLKILGFKYITQVVTRGKGRSQRPDYALFSNTETRDIAYTLQTNETAFYTQVLAIAEAKYWERQLSKVSANDKRDIFKNENPSFQISSYLTGTNVDWGILTNGREWRLYYRLASSTATEFYPIDLVELLESENVDKLENFKYFWLFFRRAAFEKDSYNKNFLERVREGSTTYATQVGNELKTLVFDQIFPDLAGGFVADAVRRGKTIQEKQVYAATLSFLYKLLFLLYAEARNLLPINTAYRDYSLIKITQEIAESVDKQRTLSQTSTKIYRSLLGLFEIVDRGDAALEVPRYNGGLFHFDFHENQDIKDYPDNHFLYEHQLSDAVLAPALDKLARFEKLPIDYSFLGVRQLGSIYEGLLEYRVVVEDGNTVKVHLENDKGERKATGSYYTPDYIVKYIVSHTLKPILAERKQRFADLMTQINQVQENFKDGRLGVQSRNGLQKDLQRLERTAQNTLLDIKICDPAMGSGHFLVEAVDFLTDELINILNEYPEHNPVLEMLEITRNSILENLQQQGITIDVNKLEDTQLLQRVVMKRCIYGVDLNPMAVELAKVSLWLHSFTIGAPLSFLDHHLRCGNSLIGTTAKEAEAKMQQEKSGQSGFQVKQSAFQLNLLTGPFVGLLRAAEIMRGVSTLSDATFAEVETSERLFKEFDKAAKPYKRLLDIYVSKYFGLKRADHFLRVYGTNAMTTNPEKMNADYLRLSYPEIWMGKNDIFYFFFKRGIDIVKNNCYSSFITSRYFLEAHFANSLRNFLFQNTHIQEIIDFGNFVVFENLGIKTCITVLQKIAQQTNKLEEIVRFIQLEREIKLQEVEDLLDNSSISEDFAEVEQSKLESDNWNLGYLKNIKIIDIIDDNCIPLGEITFIGQGMQTGSNEVFIVDEKTVKEYAIESNCIKNLIKNQDIKQYSLDFRDLYIIYPNDLDELKCDEGVGKYLQEKKDILTSRAAYIRRNCEWFKYTWPLHKDKYHLPKIIVPYIAPENRFALDEKAEYISLTDTTVIFPIPEVELDIKFILALLNSNLLNYRYRFIAKPKDYRYEYFENTLKRIPIPKISFITPPEKHQEYLENTINLYQQFQNNQNADILLTHIILHLSSSKELVIVFLYPLLIQIGLHQLGSLLLQNFHHIHQQPSEADVIHDFLAYLAEQMIELNKQKQTEIKGFLTWLERLIGTEIDNLTNKSKIQNYLGDYYKQKQGDNHLTLDELIDILKKNKKKIKIDLTTRKEQETLGKEYQSSLNILLPIKQQLQRCDCLIDEIVYLLYGLTEAEKAIIEGNL
ncbi:Eco57I restriction-modification methylase domain-containing protein [Anabaena sp. UHCC 0187]|uniref:Eco57I restriction-modification methylase domain-containing protein n=1 Tax=Anabaena sp. UHCC 0187 TaxID=2590018 RepID=UPI001C2CC4DB|nr:TaqI-like C-terminal specificity domain-containing protein [Anabaena sp. UHCC 0187]